MNTLLNGAAPNTGEAALISDLRRFLAEQSDRLPEHIGDDEVEALLREYTASLPLACLHTLLEDQALRTPDQIAVSDGRQRLTYAELIARAHRLAGALGRHGAQPAVRIAVVLQPAADLIVSLLAVLKTGAAFLLIDPGDPLERQRDILADARPQIVLTHQSLVEQFRQNDGAAIIAIEALIREAGSGNAGTSEPEVDPERLAYVFYGVDRHGLAVQHAAVTERFHWLQGEFALGGDDVVLQHSPLSSNMAIGELFWPLIAGARLAIMPQEHRSDPAAICTVIAEQRVTALYCLPSALDSLLDRAGEPARSLQSLRLVICQGELLRPALVDRFLGSVPAALYHAYGVPEAVTEVALQRCAPGSARETVPIGHATIAAVAILDSHQRPVPDGVTGEICVIGDSFASGFSGAASGQRRQLLANPLAAIPGQTLLRTGDYGRRLADGSVELLGSGPNHSWVRGFCVDLRELEGLIRKHPAIADCAVAVRTTRQGIDQLIAYVTIDGGLAALADGALLGANLPSPLIPAALVPVSALPLKRNGQINGDALSHLPVLDAQLVASFESALEAQIAGAAVVAVIQEQIPEAQHWHLADLLPEDAAPAGLASAPRPVAAQAGRAGAIADGGPLAIPADAPQTLGAGLVRTASLYPGKGIVHIAADGSATTQTYADLLYEARCILNGLLEHGLKAGDRVILQFDSSRDHFPVFWACLLGGITPVTVAIAPSYQERNAVVNKLLNAWDLFEHQPIITSRRLIEQIGGLRQFAPDTAMVLLAADDLRSSEPAQIPAGIAPDDTAFFQLTSGSTGIPKCIQITHRGVIHHIHASQAVNGYSADNRTLNWLPLDHVVPLLMYHVKDVYLGCEQIQVRTDSILAKPLRWLDYLEAYRVTHTWSPNFGYKLVAAALAEERARRWDLSMLVAFLNGGEQATFTVIQEFLDLVAPFNVAPAAMQPAYGMAELCTAMTYVTGFDLLASTLFVDKDSLHGRLVPVDPQDPAAVNFVPVGRPVPGVQIRIVDRDNRMLEEAVIGRIQVRGPVVTPGYLNNPAANQDAFVDGWFYTGDLGFLLDGSLTVTGREKEVIIINGGNFYCYEIEDIVNNIDGVEPTFSAACTVANLSAGTEALAIVFAPTDSGRADLRSTLHSIRTTLTTSLGIDPALIVPIAREDFPKTTSGKIQRTQLKQALEDGSFRTILHEVDLLLANDKTLPRWFYTPVWRRREQAPEGESLRRPTLVLLDSDGALGELVGVELGRSGTRCVTVAAGAAFACLGPDRFQIDPRRPADYQQVLAALAGQPPIERIVDLRGYRPYAGPAASADALMDDQSALLDGLLFLVQAIARNGQRAQPLDLIVGFSHSQQVEPEERIDPARTAAAGVLKTIPQEIAWIRTRHVDLEGIQAGADLPLILRELALSPADPEIAYRAGKRYVRRLDQLNPQQRGGLPVPVKQAGRYLISGGLGGMGLEVARFLGREYGARLLIVGRTPLPENPAEPDGADPIRRREALESLRASGIDVIYAAADIADEERLRALVEQAQERWGAPLDGIFHLAGTYHEQPLIDETSDAFATILRPKVAGTWALHQLIKDRPDALFVAASSVNAFFGGYGVSAYAAANAFIEAFVGQLPAPACCIAWSLWDDIGMSRDIQLRELAIERGYHAIRPAQGLLSLKIGLGAREPLLLVGLDGTKPSIRRFIDAEALSRQLIQAYAALGPGAAQDEPAREIELRDRFGTPVRGAIQLVPEMPRTAAGAPDRAQALALYGGQRRHQEERVGPRTDLERQIAALWRDVLHSSDIGVHDNFFSLGGHSIQAIQLLAKLTDRFAIDLPVHMLFNNPTIAQLAELIVAGQAEVSPAATIKPVARDRYRMKAQQSPDDTSAPSI